MHDDQLRDLQTLIVSSVLLDDGRKARLLRALPLMTPEERRMLAGHLGFDEPAAMAEMIGDLKRNKLAPEARLRRKATAPASATTPRSGFSMNRASRSRSRVRRKSRGRAAASTAQRSHSHRHPSFLRGRIGTQNTSFLLY